MILNKLRPPTQYTPLSDAALQRIRLWSAISLVLLVGASIQLVNMSLDKRSGQNFTRFTPTPVDNTGHENKVYFGLHTVAIHDVKFDEQSFQYDGYLWLRFQGDSMRGNVELMNAKGATMAVVDRRDSSAFQYVAYRLRGTISANFSLLHFPFDAQALTVEFESPRFEKNEFVFVPDSMSFSGYRSGLVGIDSDMHLSDFDIINSQIYVTDHSYPTDFGLPETGVGKSLFTRGILEIHIQRQFTPYLTKFLLPIFLMLFVTYFVFFVPVDQLEISVVICATALFTAICVGLLQLEFTMHVGYLMTTDRFYVLSYAMIILAFMEIIVASNGAEKNVAWAEDLDLLARYLFFPIAAAGMLIIALWEYLTP